LLFADWISRSRERNSRRCLRNGSRLFPYETAFILSQVRTIAAFAYRKSRGLPFIYPKPQYKYSANLLPMMFSAPFVDYELKPEVVRALDLILLLHADHEQNCSA
jgi:citrate synthase